MEADAKPQGHGEYNLLKARVNRYTLLGLFLSLVAIIIATIIVSWQITGKVSLHGAILAHKTNPALWFLDITPFMFAYWGQRFFYDLISDADAIIETRTSELEQFTQKLQDKLKVSTLFDNITGLPNQDYLLEFCQKTADSLTDDESMLFIVVSLKQVGPNVSTKAGYDAGQNLKLYANYLVQTLEQPSITALSDTTPIVARLVGNEFAVVIPKYNNFAPIDDVIKKLAGLFSLYEKDDEEILNYQPTIGATILPNISKDASNLISHGLIAVTQATNNRINYAVYDPTSSEAYQAQPLILNEVKKAIQNQDVEIYYQPLYDFDSLKIIGAEALVRVHHKTFGALNAEQFINMLEGTPLIRKYSYFVIEEAIRQIAHCHKDGHNIFITVNLSIDDVQDPSIVKHISLMLEKYHIEPKYLHVDLTEKACLTNLSRTIKTLTPLAAMGVIIAIDDFCSGHTPFHYLNHLPIKEIKINRLFVINMQQDSKKQRMIQAIISLAKIFHLTVSAEGVESEQSFHQLIRLGCHQGKGYYFSQAVPKNVFLSML